MPSLVIGIPFLQADVYERLTHMPAQAGAEPGQFLTQANLA